MPIFRKMDRRPLILIIGHGGHGKDTVGERLAQDLPDWAQPLSSSKAALPHIWPKLQERYGYKSEAEAYADRRWKRNVWHDLIAELLLHQPSFLARVCYRHSPIYIGMRNRREFLATTVEFSPVVLWVDASERLPLESPESMQLTTRDAHLLIDNNGTELELIERVDKIRELITWQPK